MTREEAIDFNKNLRMYMRLADKNQPCKFLEENYIALDMAIKALEKESCEDEYIKVPKKALKYRTAGMVAYNAEWLKNHFDIERAVICGEQQFCDDVVSRQAVKEQMIKYGFHAPDMTVTEFVEDLPPVPWKGE